MKSRAQGSGDRLALISNWAPRDVVGGWRGPRRSLANQEKGVGPGAGGAASARIRELQDFEDWKQLENSLPSSRSKRCVLFYLTAPARLKA